ncbi:hypothetical protein BDW62DRAFT_177895 [Aspergillus aurantiobrunneus]
MIDWWFLLAARRRGVSPRAFLVSRGTLRLISSLTTGSLLSLTARYNRAIRSRSSLIMTEKLRWKNRSILCFPDAAIVESKFSVRQLCIDSLLILAKRRIKS